MLFNDPNMKMTKASNDSAFLHQDRLSHDVETVCKCIMYLCAHELHMLNQHSAKTNKLPLESQIYM